MQNEIRKECYESFKKYIECNKSELIALAPQFQDEINEIKMEDLIVGEKPQFRNYKFNVLVTAALEYDSQYYDREEKCYKTKPEHFSNIVGKPFQGYCWLMDNEENSDISICNKNIDMVNNCLNSKVKISKLYSLSQKKEAAHFVGAKAANDYAFLSTMHNPIQAYVRDFLAIVGDNFKYEATDTEPVSIPILPVYLKLRNGNKVLVGVYYIDESNFVIDFYNKAIEEYRTKKNEEKIKEEKIIQQKKRKRKIILTTCIVVAIVVVVIIFTIKNMS